MKKVECPRCGSGDWKSSKLVLMEGVSSSGGTLDLGVTERGVFGDGKAIDITAFFLSDRWFDFEKYQISGGLEISTQSGLAKAVELAVRQAGSLLKMPEEPVAPVKPTKNSSLGNKFANFIAKNPKPEFTEPENHSRLQMLWRRRGGDVALLAIVIPVLFFNDLLTITKVQEQPAVYVSISCLIVVYLLAGLTKVATYNDSRLAKARKKYESKVAMWQTLQDKKLSSDKKFKAASDAFDRDYKIWEEEQKKYELEHEAWAQKKELVEAQREELWNRLIVCHRCGEVYQSEVAASQI